ncbi:sensor histidine kinase [Sphingomonas sp. PB2P12]|uniref:ATP-binding protein n=1 Tax=Sphingomonas sandaracina TaxID=3096157 RepID=UPI002FCCB5BE
MATTQNFKVSSALKDIIGRDLITNDAVAIFELVKNAFDAHAEHVQIEFDENMITIVDDGKGMSEDEMLDKWLFVAYSAKKLGEEDDKLPRDYRDEISIRRGYAGNKGIGRFSCDRLGSGLEMYSRSIISKKITHLSVDWLDFENDARAQFEAIDVMVEEVDFFPQPIKIKAPRVNGTMLRITGLRSPWDAQKISSLRSYLAKLIDPFQPAEGATISTKVVELNDPALNGPVGNDIIDLLNEKTAKLEVSLKDDIITSSLSDRGVLIYKIEERLSKEFIDLANTRLSASLFFLNRSAKQTFTTRMGVQPVSFGSIFLFVNGFRIFPVGEPTDDTFGIGRRKQQGTNRYLGQRDVLGKIDVSGRPEDYVEASSRDAGLIETRAAIALNTFVMRHLVQRLERYVVTVNWADALDQQLEDSSGLRSDTARARIIRIVQAMAGSKTIRLLDYDQELIDVVNERSSDFEESMAGLVLVAQESGNEELLRRVERSRQRYEEQKQATIEAKARADREIAARREAEDRVRAAEFKAEVSKSHLERVEKQVQLLRHAQEREDDELTLLHHQVIIYASEVQALVRRSLRRAQEVKPPIESIRQDLEQISWQNSRILAVARVATQANFKLQADKVDADLIQYMSEYVTKVAALYGDIRRANFDTAGLSLKTRFSPIDIAIVIDNLFSNAGKADAYEMDFVARKGTTGGAVEIVVTDNGRGIDEARVDISKIFEVGYSGSPRGSGLGLYHVKQVLEELGGGIGLDPDRHPGAASFIIRLPKEGKSK